MTQSDSTTFDLGQTRLRLKDGLKFSVQQGKRQTWYLVEDETRTQFFRIGAPEYTFLSLLDGKTTLATALATTCSLMGVRAFSEHDAVNLCKWLVDVELAHTESSTSAKRIKDKKEVQAENQRIQKLNPISIRCPLIELDAFATVASTYFGWIVSWWAAVVWLLTVLTGSLFLALTWDRMEYVSVFSQNNWIWIALTWIVLKGIHEFAHVLTCKKFGGRVGKGGVLFLLFIPMPYVDVTSSWKFSNKKSRILVSAAGMIAEIFLASIAAIVWCHTGPGAINFHAANVMIAASLHTLLFNANPLMRFDGYHMLADWLEIPNLGNHANQFVKGVCRKVFFNLAASPIQYVGFHGHIVKAYGFAAFIWKVLICIGLSIGAINLFHGFGLLLACAGLILWLAIPVSNLVAYIVSGGEHESPDRVRFAKAIGMIVSSIYLMGSWVPSPAIIKAPIVIEFQEKDVVRSDSAGFVSEILVADRAQVNVGDLLVVIENKELESEYAKLKIDLAQAKLRARSLQNDQEIGAWQAEQAAIKSLNTQIHELHRKLEQQNIRAPHNGQVIARTLEDLRGQFVPTGAEILTIGRAENKEAIALVSQDDARFLANKVGAKTDLRIWGMSGTRIGHFDQIEPKAVDDLPHFAFAANFGGPIDVVQRSQVESTAENIIAPSEYMMTKPRVPITMSLDDATSRQLRCGQTGIAFIRGRYKSLGGYLVDNTLRWIKQSVTTYHGL